MALIANELSIPPRVVAMLPSRVALKSNQGRNNSLF